MAFMYKCLLMSCVVMFMTGTTLCQREDDIRLIRRAVMPTNSSDYTTIIQLIEFLESYAKDLKLGDVSHALPLYINSTMKDLKRNGTVDYLKCRNDIQRISDQVALQFLDAWGKVPPGVTFGDFNWLGSYQQCIRLTEPADKATKQEAFKGKYCAIVAFLPSATGDKNGGNGFTSSGQPSTGLTIGSCFPDTCADDIVSYIANSTLQTIKNVSGVNIQAYAYCQPTEPRKVTTRASWIIALLSVIGACIVAGTFYDVVFYQRSINKAIALKEMASHAEQNGSVDEDVPILTAEEHTTMSPQEIKDEVKKRVDKEQHVIGQTLMCFSLLNNCKRLFTVASSGGSDGTLDAVHGIRFLSMSWVILGHTFYFTLLIALKNKGIAPDLIKRFTFQALTSATVSVDSFFVLSGLLVTFLALREMKHKGGITKFNWILFYVHRYWRLTIPYMLVLGVNAALFEYAGSGPMWPPQAFDVNANCAKSWWTNLLYINNLVKTDEVCFGWAWYLANDMQFYWITPIFLISYFWKWWAGLAVSVVTLLTSVAIACAVSASNHFPASLAGQFLQPGDPSTGDYFNDYYQAPWCRIGPYMVGVICGHILYKTNRKIKMHWALACLGWCVAATINLLVVYGLYGYTKGDVVLNNATAAFYNGVHRTAWGVGLCWVIFACVTGYGGIVNKMLSWSALVPLSRLTYMAYLVHPIVMMSYLMQLKYLFNYDDYSIIYLFFGHMVMSYAVAFVACMMFEAPFMALEKIVIEYFAKLGNLRKRSGLSVQSHSD